LVRFIESIRNWLSPKRSPQDLIIHLRTFSELLDINRQELEQKAEEHRQKALKYLKMGHREQAKKYLRLYHEYLTKAMSIDEYKASIDALTFQLEQAQIMDQAVKVISEVRMMLKDILVSMPSLKRITNEAEKINKMVEQMEGIKEEVLTAVKPKVSAKEISDEELEAELDQLEESLGITIEEAKEMEFPEPLEEEIKKVKEKLKKLKES